MDIHRHNNVHVYVNVRFIIMYMYVHVSLWAREMEEGNTRHAEHAVTRCCWRSW